MGRKIIQPEDIAKSETEIAHQQALFCWAALNYNKYPELKFMFHIPNGEQRSKITGARLKAAGVRAGVLDIFVPIPRSSWHGLFIELKRVTGGVVSPEQKDWIAFLREKGYGVVVCFGWLEARDTLISYLEWKAK